MTDGPFGYDNPYSEATEYELKNANSGQIQASFEDDVSVSYCPDSLTDGAVARVDPSGNDKGVWVCPKCGRITDTATNDSRGAFSLSGPSERLELGQWVIVRGRGYVDEVLGRVSFIDSAYSAKDAIKQLPVEETDRRWLSSWEKWVVATDAERELLEHMRENGWNAISLPRIREVVSGDDSVSEVWI